MSQQAHIFLDDRVSKDQAGRRVSVRPLRLDPQPRRHPAIHESFRRSHLSGLSDGYERVVWHIGAYLQIEITLYEWFEMTER
jgi:hypothetical protein